MNKKHFGLISAGGLGRRLRPWRTEKVPKQFLNIIGKDSLITQTYNRLKPCIPDIDIFRVQIKNPLNFVDSKFIITAGIKPNMPYTVCGSITFKKNISSTPENTELFALRERVKKVKEVIQQLEDV